MDDLLTLTALSIAAAGFLVGIVVGLTGMGGGALMTPALIFLGVGHTASIVTADLTAAAVYKTGGALTHAKEGSPNLRLAGWLAGRLAGAPYKPAPAGRLRFAWLFVLALYGLLLAFDGRYRDFPLGLFELPCAGYALVAWLDERPRAPAREALFLAAWPPVLAAVVVALELGESPVSWLWLALNLLIAVPVFAAWRRARFASAAAGAMLDDPR